MTDPPISANVDGPAADLDGSPDLVVPIVENAAWWAAHTRPRQEKSLATDLAAFGIHYFLPLIPRRTRSKRTGRLSQSRVPLFPGYLFFNGTDEQRRRALRTNRVAQIIVPPAQDQLVRELRQVARALAAGADLIHNNKLAVGQRARVIDGPFEGLEGVVVRRVSAIRLVLNVQALGQSVILEIADELLEAVAD
jgi:transcription antitermination factor NusG